MGLQKKLDDAQDTIGNLQTSLLKTTREREALRKSYIDLQVQIGDLIPPIDGERGNDPIIERVKRLVARYEMLMADEFNKRYE